MTRVLTEVDNWIPAFAGKTRGSFCTGHHALEASLWDVHSVYPTLLKRFGMAHDMNYGFLTAKLRRT